MVVGAAVVVGEAVVVGAAVVVGVVVAVGAVVSELPPQAAAVNRTVTNTPTRLMDPSLPLPTPPAGRGDRLRP